MNTNCLAHYYIVNCNVKDTILHPTSRLRKKASAGGKMAQHDDSSFFLAWMTHVFHGQIIGVWSQTCSIAESRSVPLKRTTAAQYVLRAATAFGNSHRRHILPRRERTMAAAASVGVGVDVSFRVSHCHDFVYSFLPLPSLLSNRQHLFRQLLTTTSNNFVISVSLSFLPSSSPSIQLLFLGGGWATDRTSSVCYVWREGVNRSFFSQKVVVKSPSSSQLPSAIVAPFQDTYIPVAPSPSPAISCFLWVHCGRYVCPFIMCVCLFVSLNCLSAYCLPWHDDVCPLQRTIPQLCHLTSGASRILLSTVNYRYKITVIRLITIFTGIILRIHPNAFVSSDSPSMEWMDGWMNCCCDDGDSCC